MKRLIVAVALLTAQNSARAAPPEAANMPPIARQVGLDEKLGAKVPARLPFTSAQGERVLLGDYLGDDKPLLLILAYHRCPMLCGLVLRSVAKALADVDFVPGKDFRIITVSIDPRDTMHDAARVQAGALVQIGAAGDRDAWPFLVGEKPAIDKLAGAIGFRYAYDPKSDLYAHPAVVTVITPSGTISRYLYGVDLSSRDVELALVDAGEGKIGSIVDRIILTCFHYDPASRRYGVYVFGFFKIGGAILLCMMAVGGVVLWRIERRRRRRE